MKKCEKGQKGHKGHQGNRDCLMSHDSSKTPTDACPCRRRESIIGRARPSVRGSEGDLQTRLRVKDVFVDREPVEREGSGDEGRRRARRSDWIGFHWISFISIHPSRAGGDEFDEFRRNRRRAWTMMTVVSMSSVPTGTSRRRRGEASRGVARARAERRSAAARVDAVATRETRANASVDGMKDARALAPTRGVGRERVVATVGTSSTAAATRRGGDEFWGGARAASLGGAAVVVGGAAAVAMNRVMKTKSGGRIRRCGCWIGTRISSSTRTTFSIVPNFAEGTVYREICKTAYEMALKNMTNNVARSNVLGHPITLSNTLNLTHIPTKSGIKEKELNAFIDDLVGETNGIPVLLPGPIERVMYTNGVLTGWTVFEDSLKTFKLQMFDREFVFSVSDDDDGKRLRRTTSGRDVLDTMPELSDDLYVEIARKELKLPGPTNVFPQLHRNIAKVAVGTLSEAVTLEAKIKGFTVELALDPYDESNAHAFATVSFGEEDREETKRAMEDLIEVCVDEYMVTRSMAISSVFLPRAIERQTYINILRGLFGDIAKEPVMTSLGFDISMRLMRPDPSSSAEGDDASTKSLDESSSGRKGENGTRTNLDILSNVGDGLRRGEFRRLASEAAHSWESVSKATKI